MSRIHEFFQTQEQGQENLTKPQHALLMVMGQMNQDDLLTPENIEAWSKRGHEKRKQIKAAMKNRNFKKLVEFHEKVSGGIPMTFPYALWITGISKRATDTYLHHSLSVYQAKKDGEPEISLGFWCNRVCPTGLWGPREWKARWKAQKTEEGNTLEDVQAWEEIHAMEFKQESADEARA